MLQDMDGTINSSHRRSETYAQLHIVRIHHEFTTSNLRWLNIYFSHKQHTIKKRAGGGQLRENVASAFRAGQSVQTRDVPASLQNS